MKNDKDFFALEKFKIRAFQLPAAGLVRLWSNFYPYPSLVYKDGGSKDIADLLIRAKDKKPLIITDKGIEVLNLLKPLYDSLNSKGIDYEVFDGVQANPSIENVEDGLASYKKSNCDCLIAVGGGSPIDTSKGILARLENPSLSLKEMKKSSQALVSFLSRAKADLPNFYAIPTTAGTGSEATIATVISDKEEDKKFPILNPSIIPDYAILDSSMTTSLPKSLTATTGLDALTHAIEAYTNILYMNKKFKSYSIKAVQLVFQNLELAYKDPDNILARSNMQKAAYYAGLAFTVGGVGYVHGIGHRLSALYNLAHGLTMAVILPHVMSDSLLGPYVYPRLGQLAEAVGIRRADDETRAKIFIDQIREMENRMNIPKSFPFIKKEDVPRIAKECMDEVYPTYPVKHIFSQDQLEDFIYKSIKG